MCGNGAAQAVEWRNMASSALTLTNSRHLETLASVTDWPNGPKRGLSALLCEGVGSRPTAIISIVHRACGITEAPGFLGNLHVRTGQMFNRDACVLRLAETLSAVGKLNEALDCRGRFGGAAAASVC